jgi:hypothetical protein
MSVSPDGLWLAALVAVNDTQAKFAEFAIPTQGGTARHICSGFCVARWAPDGKYLYVTLQPGRPGADALPVGEGQTLPDLPTSGIGSLAERLALSGGVVIEQSDLAPGSSPATYGYVKTAMHRNLFRVPVH